MPDIIPLVAVHDGHETSEIRFQNGPFKIRGYSPAVLLYPTLGMAILGGILTGVGPKTATEPGSVGLIFSLFFFANLSIVTTHFTKKTVVLNGGLFVCLVVLASVSSWVDDLIKGVLSQGVFMNTTFYWMWFFFLFCLIAVSIIRSRSEYWTVANGELIHYRLFRNVGRWPLSSVVYQADDSDLMRYILLRAGRLIIQPQDQSTPIVIDNVPGIRAVLDRLQRESLHQIHAEIDDITPAGPETNSEQSQDDSDHGQDEEAILSSDET